MPTQPSGVHLVGSINLPTTVDVFDQIPTLLPDRLRRLPDGETGKRDYFVSWQKEVVAAVPEAWIKYTKDSLTAGPSGLNVSERAAALAKLKILHTAYDDYALESYDLFKKKKDEGRIPGHVKFQVSLPGIVDVVAGFTDDFQKPLEPRYEDALTRSLYRIQDTIPHHELAIQIDAAIEFGLLEGVGLWHCWFDPIFPGIIDRLSRFANRVAPDVELGFHLCYGDMANRHFVEPKDLGLMVEVANALHQSIKRPIQWLHMPVPKGRADLGYFKPLEMLEWKVPELYLGLVHANDEYGTRQRIAKAQEVVKEFGVATECGMGRTPKEDIESIMELLNSVSAPVK